VSQNKYRSGAATLVAFALIAFDASADVLRGRVVGVSDGDTITVLDEQHQQHKVRLLGIDAPEKDQAFGQRSKQSLSGLVFNRDVEVIWTKRDRYGRVVGKVMTGLECRQENCPKELDACLEQVTTGMAWWYEKYAKEQTKADSSRYHQAEQSARQYRLGLWSESAPTPPWDWRKISR
jgi:endonuclease YncB( thermonuclease family)